MTYYVRLGEVPHKRHTQFRKESGELYHEELFSTDGFSGPSSLLYRSHPPTRVIEIRPAGTVEMKKWEFEVYRHHYLRPGLVSRPGDFLSSRTALLFNEDVTYSFSWPDRPSLAFYRNGFSDELTFVQSGSGTIESVFGILNYAPGDFVWIPRCTTIRWLPDESPQALLTIESRTPIGPPAHYRNSVGQFLERSPYCERDIRVPEFVEPVDSEGDFSIIVKTGESLSDYHVDRHPFDVIGWDGTVYPYAFNIRDFEPITGRIHQMPNVHQAFGTDGAVVCAFVPRKVDYHPDAIPAPPDHNNVDCDEVLLLLGTSMVGRPSTEFGSITLHPRGIPHGPKPGAVEASLGLEQTDGVAIMVDTFRPLALTQAAMEADDGGYAVSWL